MRTGGHWTERPDAGSPSFRRSPFARDVFFDPGRATVPRITALLVLRSTITTASAPAMRQFRGSIGTPCNCCVRFVAVVTAGSRNTHYRATRYGLLGPVFHRLDCASQTDAFGYAVPNHQRLIDPIRPTRGHIATSPPRLICDAFAVRERLGDPRVVPGFRCPFRPDMPSSTTPGISTSHKFQSRDVDLGLRRLLNGSALPNFPQLRFMRDTLCRGFLVHSFATPCQVARRPVRI